MKTLSLALTLNSVILFHSMSAGLSFQSLRNKVLSTCCSISKKTLTTLACLMVFLITIALKAGISNSNTGNNPKPANPPIIKMRERKTIIVSPACFAHQVVNLFRTRPSASLTFAPYVSKRQPRNTRMSNSQTHHAFACFRAYHHYNDWPSSFMPIWSLSGLGSPHTSSSSEPELPSEYDDIKIAPPPIAHHLPPCLRGTLLDKIPNFKKNREGLVVRDAQGKCIIDRTSPSQIFPKHLIPIITQFLFEGTWVLEREFSAPSPYAHPALYGDRRRGVQDDAYSKIIGNTFVDGNPEILELALYMQPTSSFRVRDIITINTNNFTQTTTRTKWPAHTRSPQSYRQDVISNNYRSHNPPVVKQLPSVYKYDNSFKDWQRRGSTEKRNWNYPASTFKHGLQRDLMGNRGILHKPKGRWVGIYEKVLPTDDELFSPTWNPEFKERIRDEDGDEFYLKEIVGGTEEIYSLAVPQALVILKDNDGKQVYHGQLRNKADLDKRETLYADPTISAHFNQNPPEEIDRFAITHDPTRTNTYCSLFRKRGEHDKYPTYLLLEQTGPPTNRGVEHDFLYKDQPITPTQYLRH